jgi:hypothetical protein
MPKRANVVWFWAGSSADVPAREGCRRGSWNRCGAASGLLEITVLMARSEAGRDGGGDGGGGGGGDVGVKLVCEAQGVKMLWRRF